MLIALSALAIAGCASEPVTFDVTPARPAAQIDRRIAFFHSAEFRNKQETLEPYGNKYYLPLKIGESSDKALRAAYGNLFSAVREVSAEDEAPSGTDSAAALLEPSFVALKYLNASHRMEGPYYAEVDYRFRLSDAGQTLAVWTVRGVGRYPSDADRLPRTTQSPPAPRGEQGIMVEAPRRAVDDAMSVFAHSFERVPELIRWRRGEAVEGVNAPLSSLSTKGALSPSSPVDASYPGALMLRIETAALPKPTKPTAEGGVQEPPVVTLRIALQNETEHRLALDPAEIEWRAGGSSSMQPIPPAAVAAMATRTPFGLVVTPGVGAAALPGLIAALISAAELSRHQSEYAEWSAALSPDSLTDGVIVPRGSRSGLLYFSRPNSLAGELVVRVVDLDAAVRYTVRIATADGR